MVCSFQECTWDRRGAGARRRPGDPSCRGTLVSNQNKGLKPGECGQTPGSTSYVPMGKRKYACTVFPARGPRSHAKRGVIRNHLSDRCTGFGPQSHVFRPRSLCRLAANGYQRSLPLSEGANDIQGACAQQAGKKQLPCGSHCTGNPRTAPRGDLPKGDDSPRAGKSRSAGRQTGHGHRFPSVSPRLATILSGSC